MRGMIAEPGKSKRKAVQLFLLLFTLAGGTAVWGQNAAPSWKGATGPGHWRNPRLHEVNLQLRLREKKVHEDLANGRITPEQASEAMNQIREARVEESRLFFEHGRQDITEGEKTRLIGISGQH